MCKLSSARLEAGGEDNRESLEEKGRGRVAIASDEPIKDLVVTLGESVLGRAMFLLAFAAASGVCVLLHLAKAWLSLHSLNSSMLKLNFFPLKVSPLPSCPNFFFLLFYFFSSLACLGLHFPYRSYACPWLMF